MRFTKLAIVLTMASFLSGCVFTKIVTVPMRVVGAAVSIVPIAGNTAHDFIDKGAEKIDDIPI